MLDLLVAWGVPSIISGLFVAILKYKIEQILDRQEKKRLEDQKKKEEKEEEKEKRALERERDREKLIMMQLQSARAAIVLSEATARAVQRIPDAHCNGDMTQALTLAAQVQNEQKDFLMQRGIRSLYEEE